MIFEVKILNVSLKFLFWTAVHLALIETDSTQIMLIQTYELMSC